MLLWDRIFTDTITIKKTTVDKYRHIAHFSHDNRLNKLSEQMEAQITNSASQGAEWSGNVEFTAEIKKKIIESLKGNFRNIL